MLKNNKKIREEINKMVTSNKIYNSMECIKYQYELLDLNHKVNLLGFSDKDLKKKNKIFKDNLLFFGKNVTIFTPIYFMWMGNRVSIGENTYIGPNANFMDDDYITIGKNCLIGSNVMLITPLHPISPKLRSKGYQYNKPITIGNNVWFGSNVTVMPGVKIGDNSIIGACSLVTKDIPSNVVAYGSPCKIIRKITKEDEKYFDHNRLIKGNIIK